MIALMRRFLAGGGRASRVSPRRPTARKRPRWTPPASLGTLEERVVPSLTPPASAGYVAVVRAGTDGNQGFTVSPTSQVCSTIQLTTAGIALLQHNAQDQDPTNDSIAVGLASYTLTDGDSLSLATQQLLDHTSGELSLKQPSVTLCVDVDDALCTQVDDYTGSAPLDFTTSPIDNSRFLRGAIYFEGQYVTGNLLDGTSAHVCPDEHRGQQGLTAGYWKNHFASWQIYTPDRTLGSIFAGLTEDLDPTTPGVQNPYASLADDTMAEALDYQGGPTLVDAARTMLRQATAALLNAVNTNINYPLTSGEIKVMVNDALESQDRTQILALASLLDADNSLEGVSLGGVNNHKN